MADRRELVLAAAETALGVSSVNWHSEATTKPTGLGVYRHLARQADADGLPDVSVLYMGEDVLESATGEVDRNVRVGVRCRAVADSTANESGDAALLDVLQWAEIALLTDYTLGGLASIGKLERIDQIEAQEHADTVAEALMSFMFVIQTKWGDPRQVP